MNRIVKIIMLVAVVVALAGTYSYVAAQDELSRSGWTSPRTELNAGPPPPLAPNHVLKATYINTCLPSSCSSFSLPAATFVSLDSATSISCTAPVGHTCTITDTAWIQTVNTSGSSNNAGSLSLLLDGSSAETFFSGSTGSASGFFLDGLYAKIMVVSGVSKGTHTVQTQARSIDGGTGEANAEKYEVYVP